MAISFSHLTNAELLTEVGRFAEGERQATAQLVASLAELDARRLYLDEGCSSLFTYCTRVLHLSEHAAYGRIEAARAARRFPVILDLLAGGSITLTAVGLLSPHLNPDNHREVLEAARHKSKREIEQMVARLKPQPDIPSTVRKLPTPAARALPHPRTVDVEADGETGAPSPVPVSPRPQAAVVRPLAPERYGIKVTVGRETVEKLRRAQDLLRHSIPNGDPAVIFDRALTVLLEHLERAKLAATDRPRSPRSSASRSRHIPASVKRAVWARDGGRCAFIGARGRCEETGFLEIHHVVPYASGGEATVENLELRCHTHNAHEAMLYFGTQPSFVRETKPDWGDPGQLGPDLVPWRPFVGARFARLEHVRELPDAFAQT